MTRSIPYLYRLGLYAALCVMLCQDAALAGHCVLVAPDAAALKGDQAYTARTTLTRYRRWLKELGLQVKELPENQLNNAGLKEASVAILPYNPALNRTGVQALERFVNRGGKLLVFESSSTWLAELMRVRLNGRSSSSRYGQWHQIEWPAGDHSVLPSELYQHSWNIEPASPLDTSTTVAAYWRDQRGSRRPEAAALKTPHGYWFNQVLLDGDSASKKRLLLSLVGEFEPKAWFQAAETLRVTAGIIEPWTNLRDSLRGLTPRSPRERNASKRSALVQHASTLSAQVAPLLRNGDYREAVGILLLMQHQLQKAHAMSHRPSKNEFVGVWDQNGAGLYTGNWRQTAAVLAQSGITAIFPNMLWPGKAHFRSKHIPPSKTLKLFGDQLAQATAACHEQGIEVHLWKICWKASNAPSEWRAQMKKEGRLQQHAEGHTLPWLCPSHPKNVRHEIDALVEAVRTYNVHGVHLDYIRYPDRHSCYCPTTRRAFEKSLGQAVQDWPQAALHKGRLSADFEQFRAAEITGFIRQLRRELNAAHKVKLSAAVFGKYPACIASVGQDYGAWLQDGLVDFITPMNYTDDYRQFEAWLKVQNRLPRAWGKVIPGIGAIANESELTSDQILAQINVSRKNGNRGYALFKLDSALEHRILPLLSSGITQPTP